LRSKTVGLRRLHQKARNSNELDHSCQCGQGSQKWRQTLASRHFFASASLQAQAGLIVFAATFARPLKCRPAAAPLPLGYPAFRECHCVRAVAVPRR
jgi:hypothetical protein